jgi:hypothetical protein
MGICASIDDIDDEQIITIAKGGHIINNKINNNNTNISNIIEKNASNKNNNNNNNNNNILLSARDLGMTHDLELDLDQDIANNNTNNPNNVNNSNVINNRDSIVGGEIQIQVLIEDDNNDNISLECDQHAQWIEGNNGIIKQDPKDYTATILNQNNNNATNDNVNTPSSTRDSGSGQSLTRLERVASRAHRLKNPAAPRPSKLSSLKINKHGTIMITRAQAQQLAMQKILIFNDYDPNQLSTPHHPRPLNDNSITNDTENKLMTATNNNQSPLSPESPADLPLIVPTRPRSMNGTDLVSATNISINNTNNNSSIPNIKDNKRGSSSTNAKQLDQPKLPINNNNDSSKDKPIVSNNNVSFKPIIQPKYRVATLKLNKAGTIKMEQIIEAQMKNKSNNENSSNNNRPLPAPPRPDKPQGIHLLLPNNNANHNNNNPTASAHSPNNITSTPTNNSNSNAHHRPSNSGDKSIVNPSSFVSANNNNHNRGHRQSVPQLSPCTITSIRCELAAEHGVIFHITGTKPNNLHVIQAWMDIHGDDFW